MKMPLDRPQGNAELLHTSHHLAQGCVEDICRSTGANSVSANTLPLCTALDFLKHLKSAVSFGAQSPVMGNKQVHRYYCHFADEDTEIECVLPKVT